MLLITRREQEAIVINGQIHVKIMEIKGGRVKLGFEFPAGNTVYREELFDKIQEENRAAALGNANTPPLARVLLNLPRTGPQSGKTTGNEGNAHDNNHKHNSQPAAGQPAKGGPDDE